MKKNRHIFILVALLFSILCFPVDRVLAASDVVEVPLTIKQKFENSSNEKEIDLTGTYEFRALDVGIPMQEGSNNERYDFILDGNNAEKMISLKFQHGGVYRYQLVQTSKDKENYTYDRSSYIIAVYIKNGENGKLVPQVIAEKNDGKKYGELMFYNSYNKKVDNPSKPSKPSKPAEQVQTGDSTDIKLHVMIASVALMLIVMLGYFKRNNQKENNRA